MTERVDIEHSSGIISTGDHAHSTVNNTSLHLPAGGLRTAEQVPCPGRIAELGPHSAGRLFVGRVEELAELDAALANRSVVITTGLGGVGKSTLARRYAELHQARYNPVWWIDAENPQEIEAGLAALARRLYPELAAMPDEAAAAWAGAWLCCHDGWLLILDNTTRPGDVTHLAGADHGGRLLLTSRLSVGWEEIAEPVPLGLLTPEQSAALMARAVGRAELLDDAGQLCEALGHLPLAIRMAAAYMKETGVTAGTYLARLTGAGAVLEWKQTGGKLERTVAWIWHKSLDRINQDHGPFPQELLRMLAWLAPTDIPVQLLHDLPDRTGDEVDEALGRLAAYGLIGRTGDALTVHRMVQAAARHVAGREPTIEQAVATARETTAALLYAVVPHYSDPTGWPLWRLLLPHIDALAAHTSPAEDDSAILALLGQEALFLRHQGQVSRAIALSERTMTGTTRLYGSEHSDTLTARNNLAGAYQSAGDLNRAIPLFEQTLTDRERILGPDHPNTLTSRNNLAYAYQAARDLDRAIPLYQQTLTDSERVLGPDHPITRTIRRNFESLQPDSPS